MALLSMANRVYINLKIYLSDDDNGDIQEVFVQNQPKIEDTTELILSRLVISLILLFLNFTKLSISNILRKQKKRKYND